MNFQHSFAVCAVLAFGGFQAADAAVTFSIDLDLDKPGIQDTRDAVVGEEIRGAVVLDITDDSEFNAYDVSLEFRRSELRFGPNTLSGFVLSSDNTQNVPVMTNHVNLGVRSEVVFMGNVLGEAFYLAPLTQDTPATYSSFYSQFDRFGAVAGQSGGATAKNPDPALFQTRIGNIYLFSLVATGISDSVGDNILLIESTPSFLGAQNIGTVSYNGARVSVSAIPEPSSLLALAAITGIIGVRFRRRK